MGVDNRHRELHGALVDAYLLADVYLSMTAGQGDLGLALESIESAQSVTINAPVSAAGLRILRASDAENEAHAVRIAAIDVATGGNCVWTRS